MDLVGRLLIIEKDSAMRWVKSDSTLDMTRNEKLAHPETERQSKDNNDEPSTSQPDTAVSASRTTLKWSSIIRTLFRSSRVIAACLIIFSDG